MPVAGTEESAAQTSFPNTPEQTVIEKKNGSVEQEGYSGSEDSDSNRNESQGVKIPIERRSYYEPTEKYRKTLRLSSEQIVITIIESFPLSNSFLRFFLFIDRHSSSSSSGESRTQGRSQRSCIQCNDCLPRNDAMSLSHIQMALGRQNRDIGYRRYDNKVRRSRTHTSDRW